MNFMGGVKSDSPELDQLMLISIEISILPNKLMLCRYTRSACARFEASYRQQDLCRTQ